MSVESHELLAVVVLRSLLQFDCENELKVVISVVFVESNVDGVSTSGGGAVLSARDKLVVLGSPAARIPHGPAISDNRIVDVPSSRTQEDVNEVPENVILSLSDTCQSYKKLELSAHLYIFRVI